MSKNITKNLISGSSKFDKEKNYWLDKFENHPEKSSFQYDITGNDMDDYSGAEIKFAISGDVFTKLSHLTNRSDNNLFIILTAGLTLLLSKYTGSSDIVLGTPIYKQDVEGDFLNTILPLRNPLTTDMTFKELLMQVKRILAEANEHSNYPMERLLYYLGLPKIESGYPLFETVIMLQNIHEREYIKHMNYNMEFRLLRTETQIEGVLEYNCRIYRKETAEMIASHFSNLLQNVLADLGAPLAQIHMLPQQERRQVLIELNDTDTPYPEEKVVHELFEEQVKRTPEARAVTAEDNHFFQTAELTYKQLNEKANQLARLLREKGVAADTIVALMVTPSLEMAVGILAIAKAGGAYLPITHDAPVERIEYLLAESNCKILLTQGYLDTAPEFSGEKIQIDDIKYYDGDNTDLEKICSPQNLFYTIYTSGTTGRPKGGLLTNRNLVNYATWFTKKAKLSQRDRTVLVSSFAFDLGYTIFLGSLLSGGELHLISKDTYIDPSSLLDYIKEKSITYMKMTPSLFSIIVNSPGFTQENCSTLRLLVLGGEEIIPLDVEKAQSICTGLEVMNHYGPTETTIGSVARYIEPDRLENFINRPTIGKPINNTRIYILNAHLNPLPIGIPGELCIGGDGVARGYLNRQELTKQKFTADPFRENERIYRTGDMARRLPDGNVEFLGRKDNQVKIRGFRVELGEIEARLLEHNQIKDAVIITRDEQGTGKYLCAYCVPRTPGYVLEIGELRQLLSENLPDYMIPAYFLQLEAIPLNPNGKTDKNALPEPEMKAGGEYIPPADEREKQLVDLWAESLQVENETISAGVSFFDLGGHSLSAAILIAKIHKAFDVKVPIVTIFEKPTIREQSEYIKDAKEAQFAAIAPVAEKEHYALSSAQKRLYFLQQLNPESIAYNVYDAIIVEGEPEPERLRTTFERLIRRHESLRTSFQVIDGKPVQKISLAEDIDFQMEITTIQNHGDEQQVVERVRDFIRPFDLKHAPLFRVGLLKIAPTQHLLLVDMHHIISDGISHSILVEDFSSLYSGQQLDELPLQYKDYSEWQQNPEIKLSLSNQEKYWLRKFDGEIPVLYLPTDFPRPELQSFEGDIATFELSEKESSALNKFARLMGATPFMTLLSVFYIVLFKISSQEDIVIGTPIAGRDHTDLERIIGMFVNTLALRSFPTGEQTFQTFLTMVKDETLAAFENRNYLFEDLVEKAAVQRDMSRNPLFDVMFVYRNILTSKQTTSEQQLENFQIKSYDFEHRTSKFDLTLNATESEDKFVLHFEYCTKLFKEETIEKFIQYFKKIVVSIVNSRQKKLMEIEIITGEEKKIVLYGLNQTEAEYPKDKTIYQLFEEQSNKTPDSLALAGNLSVPQSQASGYSQVTFRELHRQVVSLALELRHHGVRPGTVTGLLAERSLEMVVGMLAILAAGSAYLPLDPEYPSQRLRFMLKDSAAQRLLVTPGMPDVEGFEETTIVIPEPAAALSETTGESLNDFDSQNLAYVIYTSGTTGRPKGVPITHRAVANLICWQIEACEMDHLDRVLLLSSICFDFSVMQIHSALLSGAALLVIDKGPLLNAAVFEKYLLRQLLTHLCVVPAFLENLRLMRFPGLRRIMVGGDVCPPQLASMWLDKCAIYNCYGPTENTVMSLQARISEDDCDKPMLTIGTPIGNTTVYILDKQMLPVPNGIPGELYIGGAGVAPGYLNRPELTAEKFIPNPYARSTSENRIYKTGDLVRVLDDGTVHFLGRLDNQVKIRGFRIELGEIEAQLLTVKTVKGAVVLAEKNDKGDTHLCAYFVSDSPQAPSASDLRAYLKKRLPPYMVPSFITPLEKMPLTINGKIDRKALAALKKIPLAAGPRIAPRNRTEEKLLELWTDILGLEEELISMDSNFFLLGGHSLNATQMAYKIHQTFDMQIPLGELLSNPTITEIAALIDFIGWEGMQAHTLDNKENMVEVLL